MKSLRKLLNKRYKKEKESKRPIVDSYSSSSNSEKIRNQKDKARKNRNHYSKPASCSKEMEILNNSIPPPPPLPPPLPSAPPLSSFYETPWGVKKRDGPNLS
nr:MAG: hypothetical protein [Porcellio scaber clopovirus]